MKFIVIEHDDDLVHRAVGPFDSADEADRFGEREVGPRAEIAQLQSVDEWLDREPLATTPVSEGVRA